VIEEEGEFAEGDLVTPLDGRHPREPSPVEQRAVAGAEIPDEPLVVLKTDLGLLPGYGDVVDDDF
jgi:hypothetical protein